MIRSPDNQQNVTLGTIPGSIPDVENTPSEINHSKKTIRRTGSGFTPSIKDAISGKLGDEPARTDAKEVMKYYTSQDLQNPFTQEQFEAKWKEYVDRLTERPSLKSALARVPEIFEGCKLRLQVGNSVLDDEIGKIKPELVSWLRRELQNTGIELVTEIAVVETESKPLTESDRFIEMMKKNPNINLLRQKFNLDFGE